MSELSFGKQVWLAIIKHGILGIVVASLALIGQGILEKRVIDQQNRNDIVKIIIEKDLPLLVNAGIEISKHKAITYEILWNLFRERDDEEIGICLDKLRVINRELDNLASQARIIDFSLGKNISDLSRFYKKKISYFAGTRQYLNKNVELFNKEDVIPLLSEFDCVIDDISGPAHRRIINNRIEEVS